jgi:hypothetical protein
MESSSDVFYDPMLAQFSGNCSNQAAILSILAPAGITRLSISGTGGLCFINSCCERRIGDISGRRWR